MASASSASSDLPAGREIERLLDIMARLRNPEGGCPWDIEQTFASIAPYTIEEAYEVADAVERGDMDHLRDELGDLLLQVVFHARMAEEQAAFDFTAVTRSIIDKMIRRHPHVFPRPPEALSPEASSPEALSPEALSENRPAIVTAEDQTAAWETQKASERAAKAAGAGQAVSVLDDVSAAYPALLRALKLQKRAARVGFDWDDPARVLDKLREETAELEAVLAEAPSSPDGVLSADPARLTDEIGDMLFVVVNLARHLKIDPETALRHTNTKFERRFRHIETALAASGRTPQEASLDEMEALWQQAKTQV